MLEISLLGGFGLRVGGREVAVSRKARALLAYLATNPGQPATRDAVSDLVWSRRGAEQARHSLRQTLVELRRVFAAEGIEPLQADIGTLKLVPERIAVDAARMRAAAAGASTTDWAEADRLYTGPFLHNFPAIAQGFDDWLTQERTTWAERALEAIAQLADNRMQEGAARAAVSLCERMLVIDPMREDNHRRLMTAYTATGRRADAVRQYHACVAMLRQDLDVGPSRETEELFHRLRTGNDKVAAKPSGFSEAFARGPEPRPSEGPPWIAVLPFRAMGPDAVPDYFAAGLVDDIVGMLATRREVVVISSGSCLMFRDQVLDLRRVRAELGVRYVVSGAIRRAGPKLRTAVELAEASSGIVMWAHAYDTIDTQLFEAQDNIARQVVNVVVPHLHQAEMKRIQGKHPDSMSAYDLVLNARDLIYRLEIGTFDQAGALLRRAQDIDPQYSTSHAMFADWLNLRIGQGWSLDPAQDAKDADTAAVSALTHDPLNARALALHGHNRSFMHRDYTGALTMFERALESAPNDAGSWMWSASTFAYIGDGVDAVRRAEHALHLSPRDMHAFRFHSSLALAHYTNGSYEEATHWGQLAIAESPHYTSNLRFTAASYAAMGRTEPARILAAEIMRIQPDFRVGALREWHPYRDASMRNQIADHLVLAGLPE